MRTETVILTTGKMSSIHILARFHLKKTLGDSSCLILISHLIYSASCSDSRGFVEVGCKHVCESLYIGLRGLSVHFITGSIANSSWLFYFYQNKSAAHHRVYACLVNEYSFTALKVLLHCDCCFLGISARRPFKTQERIKCIEQKLCFLFCHSWK